MKGYLLFHFSFFILHFLFRQRSKRNPFKGQTCIWKHLTGFLFKQIKFVIF
jgi:hypothetical protein